MRLLTSSRVQRLLKRTSKEDTTAETNFVTQVEEGKKVGNARTVGSFEHAQQETS